MPCSGACMPYFQRNPFILQKGERSLCHIYIYIYIYITYAVELKKLVQDLGVYKLKTGPSYKLKTGPSFFAVFPSFIVFLTFLETQIVSQCVKIVFLQNFGLSKMRFSKRKLHFLFFFYVGEIETKKKKKKKKRKWKRPKNPYKNRVF